MSTCWSIGALLWCLFMLAATQEGVRLQRVAWLPVAAAAVLIGSFVLCQLPLHQAMVRYKAGQVQRLEPFLRDLLNKGIEHLAPDEMQRVRFIEERIALAAKLPEWPAGWGSLVRVSWLSSLAPVLKYVEALVKDPHVRQIFARLSGTEGG
jgi:hypothetical protein